MEILFIELQTPNFTFSLFVRPEAHTKEIRNLLMNAATKHCQVTGGDLSYFEDLIIGDNYSATRMEIGRVYRDRQSF